MLLTCAEINTVLEIHRPLLFLLNKISGTEPRHFFHQFIVILTIPKNPLEIIVYVMKQRKRIIDVDKDHHIIIARYNRPWSNRSLCNI